jgi:hypothetical protein
MSNQISQCGSCGKPVHFLTNLRTFKLAPIEAEPSPIGNCVVDLTRGTYGVLGPAECRNLREREPETPLFLNHFSTCPAAKTWARGGSRNVTTTNRKG